MNNELKCITDGYLYRVMNDNLEEYCGKLMHRKSFGDLYGFFVYDENGNVLKDISCSMNEKEIMRGVVWFKERNRVAAAKLLIDYKLDQIAKEVAIIERYKRVIDILKKELETE